MSEEQPDEITAKVAQLWCQPEHKNKEMDVSFAYSIVGLVKSAIAQKEKEVESWKESAAQFCRNADFYRSIVTGIGEQFGEAAHISDDGSRQQDVLCLKVPELVMATRESLAQKERELVEAQMPADCGEAGHFKFQMNGNTCLMCQRERSLCAARDQEIAALKEKLEYFTTGADNAREVIDALKAENEVLRKQLAEKPFWTDEAMHLKTRVPELEARAEKLEAFKTWVHAYLDKKGVPAVIEDEHLAAGCRIGGRMDWVFAKIEKAEAGLAESPARQRVDKLEAEQSKVHAARAESGSIVETSEEI